MLRKFQNFTASKSTKFKAIVGTVMLVGAIILMVWMAMVVIGVGPWS